MLYGGRFRFALLASRGGSVLAYGYGNRCSERRFSPETPLEARLACGDGPPIRVFAVDGLSRPDALDLHSPPLLYPDSPRWSKHGVARRLGIALLAGCAFVIGTPSVWTVSGIDALDQGLEVCVFCLVGGVSGLLTDRHRNQERTLLKTGNQLRQANRELEENFEKMKRAERIYALAQLSAGLAHEIRTPLASLEGAAALLQRETQSEERRREFLDIIQKESRRLNRLLTRFLEFAKPGNPS